MLAAAALLVASGCGLVQAHLRVSQRSSQWFWLDSGTGASSSKWRRTSPGAFCPSSRAFSILVEALNQAGLLTISAYALRVLQRGSKLSGDFGASFGVAILANVMNNLPVGLASGDALAQNPAAQRLAHAVLIGVDIGPNLSVTGSLATILWLIALRRENVEMTPGQFFRVGVHRDASSALPERSCSAGPIF